MKRLAGLAVFLLAASAFAADKPGLPPFLLCTKVKGLEGFTLCDGHVDYSQFPLDLIKDSLRNEVAFLGFLAANAYFPPPLMPQQERQRELGRKMMEAAPYVAFPELGDPVTKNTPAVAYCSSSVGNGMVDPFQAQGVKATGKGRCEDFMTVYLRPEGK